VTLDTTPIGSAVRIVSIDGSGVLTLRLMEMGMVPGAPARVIKSAPLGDPIHICLGDYHLALRRNEARTITVAMCD
jgi:ferrous iron transport protein A